jgi:hypothetical protein|tara:strand:- start:1247 stop:1741 length:495 start_codon:yes stop_codon:yes gene_type:complete
MKEPPWKEFVAKDPNLNGLSPSSSPVKASMAQLKETLKSHRLPALISSPSNVFENALVNAGLFGGLDPQARETPPRKIKTTGEIEDHVHDLSRNTTAAKNLKNRLPNGLNPNLLICLNFHGKTATALSPLANRISDPAPPTSKANPNTIVVNPSKKNSASSSKK